MTLLELTEPLFQYVCRLNRLARKSGKVSSTDTPLFSKGAPTSPSHLGTMDYAVARSEVKALLDEMRQKANADLRLATQYQKVELPLVFFVDSMISESNLGFAAQWNQNRLAYDRNELAGDEKFFDLLDETLKDSGDDASERLAVFYTCIGLGFAGVFFRQPEYLRRTMLTIAPRIRHVMEADQGARICPESYEGVDTRNLVQPASSRLALIVILFLCFTLATLITYFLLYREASNELSNALTDILDKNPAVLAGSATK